MKKIMIIILLVLSVYSCKMFVFGTDTFVLNRNLLSEEIIYGVRINGFKQMKVINENTIELYDTAIAGLTFPKVTQFKWDFGVDFSRKSVVNVFLRTTATDFLNNQNNIKLTFDAEKNEFSCFEDNQLKKTLSYNFNNELRRIKIENYDKKIKVSIDRDDIIDYKTEKESTEYIIFQNTKLDTLNISAISVCKHYY